MTFPNTKFIAPRWAPTLNKFQVSNFKKVAKLILNSVIFSFYIPKVKPININNIKFHFLKN